MIAGSETAAVGSETTQCGLRHDRRVVLCSLAPRPAARDGYRKSIMFSNQSFGSWRSAARRFQIGGEDSRSGQHHTMQNGCVMTTGRDQHEAVPYCVVERQRPPEVKAGPDGIEHAANSDQNRCLNV